MEKIGADLRGDNDQRHTKNDVANLIDMVGNAGVYRVADLGVTQAR